MSTFDDLHTASFDGIEFEIDQRTISGGRAFARRRYPYRPGQSVEDTGREPYHFTLTIPLFEDVDPEQYPNTYNQLRAVFDDPDTQGEAEYVDPELGPINCKVARWSWQQTSEKRNGGEFSVELEEVSFDDVLFAITPTVDSRGAAQLDSLVADDGLGELGISPDMLTDAMSNAGLPMSPDELGDGGVIEGVTDSAIRRIDESSATVDDMGVAVDVLRRRLDVVTALEAMQAPEAWSTLRLLSSVCARVSLVAEEAGANAASVRLYTTTAPLSAWDLAVMLYDDGARAEELMARNPTRNPLAYPPGYQVRYLSR